MGLDVHAVAESTRITLDRQLHAFRDDEVLTVVFFFLVVEGERNVAYLNTVVCLQFHEYMAIAMSERTASPRR